MTRRQASWPPACCEMPTGHVAYRLPSSSSSSAVHKGRAAAPRGLIAQDTCWRLCRTGGWSALQALFSDPKRRLESDGSISSNGWPRELSYAAAACRRRRAAAATASAACPAKTCQLTTARLLRARPRDPHQLCSLRHSTQLKLFAAHMLLASLPLAASRSRAACRRRHWTRHHADSRRATEAAPPPTPAAARRPHSGRRQM